MPDRRLFTSESVTEGHPDKVADAISDADSRRDPRPTIPTRASPVRRSSRPASPCVAGEITTYDLRAPCPRSCARRSSASATPMPAYGFDSQHLRRDQHDRPPVARHRDGRRHRRRRRPGDDVRLRERRDRRADADADHRSRTGSRAALAERAEVGGHRVAPPRRQVAGHRRVRRQPAGRRRDRRRLDAARATTSPRKRSARRSSSNRSSSRRSRRSCATRRSSTTSTRPAASSSAARRATPGSPVARSSSTRTAAWVGTAAARSAARIHRRSIARPATRRDGSPRTSSRRNWRGDARCRSPTRSASPSRFR